MQPPLSIIDDPKAHRSGDVAALVYGHRDTDTLAALLDQSLDCIKLISLSGTLEYMNLNGLCVMEIDDFSTVKGKMWASLWPKESRSLIEGSLMRASEGKPVRFDAFCPTVKGTPRWWDVSVSRVLCSDGKNLGYLSISRDVTEARAAREAAGASEQLISSLQNKLLHAARVNAMGAMASTIAHELNQPLTTITNYAAGSERLVENGAQSSELAKPLAEIRNNASRAGEIIRKLREMTRNGMITKEAFYPDSIIKEAGILGSAGACAGLELQYDFCDGKPVLGEPIQIQQVLINIVSNACAAVAEGSDPMVRIVSQIAGDCTLISVEDNGPGISPDNLPNLFDAFFSTKGEGMGVGLSISRTIIEAHGGKIWAENRPEGGARFSFTLLLAEASSR